MDKVKLLVLTMGVLVGQSLWAATFTVTKTSDVNGDFCMGFCSLRGAITAANANPGQDTIIIPAGTFNLTQVGDDNSNVAGDLDILDSVTIQGAGSDKTIINATAVSDRVINITGNASPTVAISGVTIKGGNAGTSFGGGIFQESGNLQLSSSVVTGNTASKGGGIYIGDHATLTQVQITQNTATTGGGGVYCYSNCVATISQSTIANNTAGNSGGGGIFNDSGSTTVTSSWIKNNSGNFGGGIRNTGTMALNMDTIDGNSAAASGGGISYNPGFSSVSLTLANSTVINNTAQQYGAGIYSQPDGVSTAIVNSTIANNTAAVDGGAIYNASANATIFVRSSTIVGNSGTNGNAVVSVNGGGFDMANTILANNVAADCTGSMVSLYDLIEKPTAECQLLSGPGDQLNIQPGLGAFVNGSGAGGGYFTLTNSSPAINAGNTTVCESTFNGVDLTKDQLGHLRGTPCDIGAIAVYCGDGTTQSAKGEECDDANTNDLDACTNSCKTAKCGDGLIQAGVEQCDDGNPINDDACPNTCILPTCGDGILQANLNEQCDEGGNNNNIGACLTTCQKAKCGDGLLETSVEDCDDGNVADGDGCSALCKVEPKPEPKVADGGTDSGTTQTTTTETTSGTPQSTVPGTTTQSPTATTGASTIGGAGVDAGSTTDNTPASTGGAPASSGGGCSLLR